MNLLQNSKNLTQVALVNRKSFQVSLQLPTSAVSGIRAQQFWYQFCLMLQDFPGLW